ncbi:MAG: 2-oxoacid:acceptor oxidoreductase family protein [Bacillota bacterium]|jgi:2-oxoglutarate ferredoxin oxidoreductase subunit gamma
MESAIEFRLGGSGGQGLILAGIILADAAILEGKNAVQTQSYGPEARGGASKAEVIISYSAIDYPKVTKPHVLLCLSDEAYRKYGEVVDSNGIIITDTSMNLPLPDEKTAAPLYKLPVLSIAREKVGRSLTANMVALGCLNALAKAVSNESMEKAICERVPEGTAELNLKAYRAGLEAAQQLLNAK